MDIRSYFGSTSQGSSDAKADSDSNTEDHGTDSSDPESSPSPPPSKKVCKSSKNKRYHHSVSTKRKYSKSWKKDFSWLYYDEDREEPFARSASNLEFLVFSVLEGCGSQNPSKIGRKLLKK